MSNILKVKLLHPEAKFPERGTSDSAGLDLSSTEDVWLHPGDFKVVATGISIEIPSGNEGQIRPRSGLAAKNGVTVLNAPGTIDSDFRGEIKVILINHSKNSFHIEPRMRIAQLVISSYNPVVIVSTDVLEETERGEGGFGSTGV